MAFSKASHFDKKDYNFSMICKLLSHPARIMILRILSRKGTVPVHELLHEMPLSGPTVSHHLSKLRKMKFITHGGAGGYIYYSINEEDQLKRHVLVKILLDSLE